MGVIRAYIEPVDRPKWGTLLDSAIRPHCAAFRVALFPLRDG